MRLRVQTLPPLPELRAWFIPDAPQVPSSILDLKGVFCSQIIALNDAGIRQADIRLLLDEFELLNESPYATALRDGDLVCIEARPGFKQLATLKVEKKEEADTNSRLLGKRKWMDRMKKKPKKRSRLEVKKVEEPDSDDENDSSSSSSSSSPSSSSPSSSSSSSAKSSSSSSSSSSDSEKSDSPESGSEITTSPSSAPQVKSLKPPAQKPKQLPLGPFVPPGQGKSTTHARNLRRKRLRVVQAEARTATVLGQTQATQALPSLPRSVSQTNATPLGYRAVSQRPTVDNGGGKEQGVGPEIDVDADVQLPVGEVEPEEKREVMMASLGNKNKKKGYKQFLMAPVPKKIVFAEGEGEMISTSGLASTSSSAPMGLPVPQALTSEAQIETLVRIQPSPSRQRPLPRLVPPSEIQERGNLPPNMFVTSVDVEADLWNPNGKKKRKNKQKQVGALHEHNDSFNNSYNNGNGYLADEDVTSTYGNDEQVGETVNDAQPNALPEHVVEPATAFDWNKAEKSFDKAPKVAQLDDFKQASIIGWKSLDLNPQTFTPEILLVAAKVLEVSHPVSTVKVQRLLRPVAPNSGFSGFLALADPDGAEVEGDTEEHQWTDILTSDWRILQVA
ncbi:hypothetical protein P691DRAFT_760171 [Macrolepiota fuliginosa MF-IS2]|uniref:Coilin n=1 Tax=Macrolepiota fuliginosa MF-IS2 TaxID=1400762 RepID=A0A9P5XE53_9AGAR|nr:hypothetical protein P691DRAFT_760171 [Macrolepiota fuliginosa MF-IS2]